jgi:endo-1,4-beta-xylanase
MPINRLLTRRNALFLGIGAFAFTNALLLGKSKYLGDWDQAPAQSVKASLKNRAASMKLIYGATSGRERLYSDAEFAARFVRECEILVPENDLKWTDLRPSPDRFDFSKGDWLLQFARTHGMLLRGHTLVWHESLPPWFKKTVNRQNAEQFLTQHIQKVVGHYAGQIHSWDVVNEAIRVGDKQPNGLRKTPWLELLGADYIDLAFRVAAEADPKALLVYNDYGLEYDIPNQEAKRNAVLKLLERLKSRGVPIHALGMQSHLNGNEKRFNPRKLQNFMRNVADLGLKILITELDVTDKDLPVESAVRDRMVAKAYEDYLNTVLKEPAVIAVLTWGLSDRYTWLSKFQPRSDGAPVRPLPLDADLKPKLAWNAIAKAFDNAPKR